MNRRHFLSGMVSTAGLAAAGLDVAAAGVRRDPASASAASDALALGEVLLESDLKSSLPPGAEIQGGQWKIQNERLVQEKFGARSLLLLGSPDWNDYSACVRVRFPAPAKGTEAGFALQVRDPGNCVIFSLKNKKGGLYAVLRIESSDGLEFYVNAPYMPLPLPKPTTMVGDQSRLDADPGTWHELRVDVHDTEFYAYVDGKPVAGYDFKGQPAAWYAHKPMWKTDPSRGRLGLISIGWPAEFQQLEVRRLASFAHISTPLSGRRDAQGRLLPRQSYAETMRRFTEWTLRADEVVDTTVAPPSLQHLDPLLLSIWVFTGDEGLNFDVGEFAFNAAMYISGAVQYYLYSGDSRVLAKAQTLADWGIANSTPAEWAAAFLAPSIVRWLPDGSWEGMDYEKWGLEPDKSAYLGDAYLRLYLATENRRYLEAAQRIAGTLGKLREKDGHWPFRIEPRSGRVNYSYTHSQLWYIRFFERLARVTSETRWLEYSEGALKWLLANPVKTNNWQGLYGDFKSGAKSYDQWVPLEFAQYLLDRRTEHPEYLEIARGILDWVYKTTIVMPGLHEGVPGVIEQSAYPIVIAHHELRLAQTHAVLWGATGDSKHREMAKDVANSVTWLLMSDGKMRMGHWYHATCSYMRCLTFNDQFTRIMAEIPETAPRDENHLLHFSGDVSQILYGDSDIRYRTLGAGSEVFILRDAPRSVVAGGKGLEKDGGTGGQNSWAYDAETHVLRVRHRETNVQILL